MRIVLETAALVAAFRSERGASRQLLLGSLSRELTAVISVPLMIEYEAVLTRPEHLAAAGISEAEASAVLDSLAEAAERVELSFRWRPTLRDPDDDMVLETAINGRAEMIVTFNIADFTDGCRQFGIDVARPDVALTQWRQRG